MESLGGKGVTSWRKVVVGVFGCGSVETGNLE